MENNLFVNAKSYSNNSDLQRTASQSFLGTYHIKGNENILDIGCGYGLWANHFASKVTGKVIGIDSSATMIDLAKEKYQRNNLYFEVMNAQDVSFKTKFDLIISTFCLHWVPDKQLTFQKMANQLREGGTVMAIMPLVNKDLAEVRKNLFSGKWAKYLPDYKDPNLAGFDDKYHEYAQKAGLLDIEFDTEKVVTRYNNTDELKGFIVNITPATNLLPNQNLKEDFINDLLTQYLIKNPTAIDGSCEISLEYAKLIATQKYR